MKETEKITVYDLSDRYDGFYIEKRQTGNGIEFYLLHKDYDDEMYVVGGSSYDEAEMKYYIWANTDWFIDEFADCIISEEDGD